MTIKTLALTLFSLFCIAVGSAEAQSYSKGNKERRNQGMSLGTTTSERMLGGTIDVNDIPVGYKAPSDEKLKELEKTMEDKSWESEYSAWQTASRLNTKEAYQKYIAIYPNGPHRPEANQRLIDIDVNNIFNGSHNKMPMMKHVEEDDESPTSTITVENATGYHLTVMYSGMESRKVVIPPGQKSTVTLKNGDYRIAASVPPAHIRPYAGRQIFTGGRYETGYVVVGDRF